MNNSQVMTINLGPHHPSTHGVLRVLLDLDGETIVDARPDMGFLHRGIEKIAENRLYHQIIPLTDRLDYLAAMSNNLAYVLTVEKLLDIDVPRRARYVRVILAELQRIASHLFWLGTHAHDVGAMSPMFYALREREMIMDIFDGIAGSRLTPSYLRFGGLYADIDRNFVKDAMRFVAGFDSRVDEYEALLTDNPIWRSRTRNVGILNAQDCIALGISGPILRGSGLDWDIRKSNPYSSYDEFQFEIPIGKTGDVYDRYLVRLAEMRQSAAIIAQALEGLPAGSHINADAPTTFPDKKLLKENLGCLVRHFNLVVEGLKPPAGEVYQAIESPRGELGFYVVSDGSARPARVKVRPPSFVNLQGLARMCRGRLLSDAVAIIGMIDIVLAEVDR